MISENHHKQTFVEWWWHTAQPDKRHDGWQRLRCPQPSGAGLQQNILTQTPTTRSNHFLQLGYFLLPSHHWILTLTPQREYISCERKETELATFVCEIHGWWSQPTCYPLRYVSVPFPDPKPQTLPSLLDWFICSTSPPQFYLVYQKWWILLLNP